MPAPNAISAMPPFSMVLKASRRLRSFSLSA